MFYSSRHNLLFIAAPKTGSTSVEDCLLKLDPDGQRFRITLPERTIDSSQVRYSLGHATASELRQLLGAERYDSMITVGFVRHPIEKLMSAYHFSRGRKLAHVIGVRTAKSKWALASKRVIAILMARILPFPVWSRIYPMKRCSDYFLDDSGALIVKYLGNTNRLANDLKQILRMEGIEIAEVEVPHLNRSNHGGQCTTALGTGFLETKYADDIKLFELVKDHVVSLEQLRTECAGNVRISPASRWMDK